MYLTFNLLGVASQACNLLWDGSSTRLAIPR